MRVILMSITLYWIKLSAIIRYDTQEPDVTDISNGKKNPQQLSYFIHLCQADSNSCNMWLPLKATRNHMCESPAPSDAHTHTGNLVSLERSN